MSNLPYAILIIGAGHMQLEHIRWARELGLYTIVTDYRKDAPAIPHADEFHQISGNDVSGLTTLAMELNRRLQLIGAYSGSDFGLPAVSAIHQRLGLPGCPPQAVTLALNKSEAKAIWRNQGLPTPAMACWRSLPSEKEVSQLSYPIIIKPLDSCGSQGVQSVNRRDDVEAAYHAARQHSDQVLMEEYFDGYGIDTIGIIFNGEFIPCGIGDRYFSTPPYHFPTHGVTPSGLPEEEIAQAYALTAQACLSLGLDNTPVKADLLYKDGQFTLLEVSPRFHGDVFTTKLIPFSTSYSPVLHWFSLLLRHATGHVLQAQQPDTAKPVLWKALFPLRSDIDFNQVEAFLRDNFDLLEFFYEPRRYRNCEEHKDNTSLVGFFWIRCKDREQANAFLSEFSTHFDGVLL